MGNGTKKNNSRSNYVFMGALTEFSFQIIQSLFPFFLRTIFIKKLGSEYLGLNGLCTSILGTLNVLDFGIDSILKYKLYKPVSEHNWEYVGNLLNFIRKFYFLLGFVILCVSLCIMPFLSNFIKSDIPDGVNIYFVFCCFLAQTVISYWFYNYYQILFLANQNKASVDVARMCAFLCAYVVQGFAVFFRFYYLYTVSQVFFPLIFGLILKLNVKRKFPLVLLKGKLPKTEISIIWRNTLYVAIFRIRTSSRTVLDNMIISSSLGLIALSNYNNYILVATIPVFLCNIITSALAPSIGNFQVNESRDNVNEIFHLTYLLQLFFVGLFSICYYELIQSFINFWLGESFILSDSFILLLTLQIFLSCLSGFFSMFRESLNLWEYGKVFAGIEIILNLILDVILAKVLGLSGIVLATVLTILFINIPVDVYVIEKIHFKKNIFWIVTVLVMTVIVCFVSDLIIKYIMSFIKVNSIFDLIIKCIITVIITLSIFCIFFVKLKTFRKLLGILWDFIQRLFGKK